MFGLCLGLYLAHCPVFECTPEKRIDAQEILLGKGLSSYLYLIWLWQQRDKADDLLWNRPWPRRAVALFTDKILAYALPLVCSGNHGIIKAGKGL